MRPRLGFLGVGWIGLDRLKAALPVGEPVAVCDPSAEAVERALAAAPNAEVVPGLSEMFELGLDGLVIATPSALHAEQAITALERGVAVFCQKPLGRDGEEVRRIVEVARTADRRLGVDLSYRSTRALRAVRDLARSGALGEVYAADLWFHNAYGPDKDWYLDRRRSGGGCVMDLGIHLVDAVSWIFGFPAVTGVRATCWRQGRRLVPGEDTNEDHAIAELALAGGPSVRLACSWWLPAGRDAEIGVDLWGTKGAARFRNVDGSFYDFVADRCRGTTTEQLVTGPDAWGGRAIVEWVESLSDGSSFDDEISGQVLVADVLEAIHGSTEARLRLH